MRPPCLSALVLGEDGIYSGRIGGGWAGRVDAALSGKGWCRLVARQHSPHPTKPES